MRIPAPKAKMGDIVQVLNYRCCPRRWEKGEVRAVSYTNKFGIRFYWRYDIFIFKGKGYFLYVDDENIKSANEE